MKSVLYHFFLSLCLFAFIGCEDFFETALELDTPEFRQGINVIGEAFAGDTVITLRVNQAKSSFSTEPYTTLKNAVIKAKINGEAMAVNYIQFDSSDEDAFVVELVNPLRSGDRVEIELSHPGFPTAYIDDIVPPLVELNTGPLIYDATKDQSGDGLSRMNFSINYINGNGPLFFTSKAVYYQTLTQCVRENINGQFVCVRFDTIILANERGLTINDPNAVEGSFGSMVKQNDGGVEKQYVGTIPNYFVNGLRQTTSDNRVEMNFISMSEQTFNYEVSLSQYYASKDNPFATPVNVFGNVQNGYGRLTLKAVTRAIVPVE